MVAKDDVIVDDKWYTLGLRGTGSQDPVADHVLVPAYRTMPTRGVFDGVSPHRGTSTPRCTAARGSTSTPVPHWYEGGTSAQPETV